MSTIWQKEGAPGASDWFFEFTAAEDREYDRLLVREDILVNIAQARMLARIGLITATEAGELCRELVKLYKAHEEGGFTLSDEDEDVHSAVERRLTEELGDLGGKIHAGRSRNDQVVADIRLWLKRQLTELAGLWIDTAVLLHETAVRYNGVYFAGHTHMQPAMPTSVDAWAHGYISLLLADLENLKQALHHIDRSPLGSAAGYGVPLIAVDREFIASELGFGSVQAAVTAVQLSRGASELRVVDAMGYGASTFNRMAADVVGFVHPDRAIATVSADQQSGSSIMPQKKNPDIWELIRASGHEYGGWRAVLAGIGANQPSGYHRDLQLTKKTVMQASLHAVKLAGAVCMSLRGLSFNPDACRNTLSRELFATREANRLTADGVPFREAYRRVAASLNDLTIPDDEQIRADYAHTGAPGHYHPEDVISEIKQQVDWLTEQKTRHQKTLAGLLE
ncbi:MAG: argininosuccinate lyase [Balneolaceae bacterium]|nr:MAG: argininosuccinate lyase [Balneolaceae bacterium]